MTISTPSIGVRGLVITAIFGVLASGFSAVSAAEPATASITVKYADLNLENPSGVLALYERIRRAAKDACNYFWFESNVAEARCVENTIASAVTKVDRPALSAIYNAKFKISVPSLLVSQSR